MFRQSPFIVLLLIVVTVILLRLYIESLRNSASLKCPKCGEPLYRIKRIHWEYIVSFLLPVRPYNCENKQCLWLGLRLKPLRKK